MVISAAVSSGLHPRTYGQKSYLRIILKEKSNYLLCFNIHLKTRELWLPASPSAFVLSIKG